MRKTPKKNSGFTQVSEVFPAIVKPDVFPGEDYPKPITPIQKRLVTMPLQDDNEIDIVYQHSVMCQTCLPYRDPKDLRSWERRNGRVSILVEAGKAYDGETGEWFPLGLPFGPKARLVLYHLNAEAMRSRSPILELEDSLTAFVKRTLGLDTNGRNMRNVKHQLNCLAAADFRFGMGIEGRSVTLKSTVIEGFELWSPKDEKQRVLWPTTIQFSQRYFDSLMNHAVPLNEEAVARLSHNAMALDVYTWLAQRLHRVDPSKPGFVPWTSLKEQFGDGYVRMNKFKEVFRRTLKQVKIAYKAAGFDLSDKGMILTHSRPPVPSKFLQIK